MSPCSCYLLILMPCVLTHPKSFFLPRFILVKNILNPMKFENIALQQVEIEPTFKAQEMGTKYWMDFCPPSHLNKSLESLGQNYEGLEGDG